MKSEAFPEEKYAKRPPAPQGMWWPFSSIKVIMIFNCCNINTLAFEKRNPKEDPFAHELEHAKDFCYGTRDSGCEGSICTEIKAYTSGGCKGLKGDALKSCLHERAWDSSSRYCSSKEEYSKIFYENYDKCIENMPH